MPLADPATPPAGSPAVPHERGRRPVVLVVLKGLAMGGAEKVLLAQAEAWDRTRFAYHLTYLRPDLDLLAPAFEELGVEVHRPPGTTVAPSVLGGFRSLVRRLKPDVIHAHLPMPGILARFTAPRGTAVVYSEHSMPSSHRALTRVLNRMSYGRNDLVVCVSAAVYEAVKGFPHRRMVTVPNAVGLPRVVTAAADVRERLGVAPGQKLVVHVGNLRRVKGQEHLVRATALLLGERRDVRVVSAGHEDEAGEMQRMERLAAATGAAEAIAFLGQRHDVPDLLNAADLVVNPSESEGLPVALLEAMMLAKPIVATAVGGVPALLPDGTCGLLVPPKDPAALAAAMGRLLSDEALAARLGGAAREVATEHHSLEAAVGRLENAYLELMGEKKAH